MGVYEEYRCMNACDGLNLKNEDRPFGHYHCGIGKCFGEHPRFFSRFDLVLHLAEHLREHERLQFPQIAQKEYELQWHVPSDFVDIPGDGTSIHPENLRCLVNKVLPQTRPSPQKKHPPGPAKCDSAVAAPEAIGSGHNGVGDSNEVTQSQVGTVPEPSIEVEIPLICQCGVNAICQCLDFDE